MLQDPMKSILSLTVIVYTIVCQLICMATGKEKRCNSYSHRALPDLGRKGLDASKFQNAKLHFYHQEDRALQFLMGFDDKYMVFVDKYC